MRRTMVVGAVILAVLAVIGIGVAAFNAGVDEGITRELAQSGDTDQVVRVVGHGYGYGYGRGFGFPFGLILFPLFIIGLVLLFRGAFARGRWGGPRWGPGGWGPGGPGGPGGYGPPGPWGGPGRSTSTTGASTSSPGRRPVPVTPPLGAPPARPRPTPGPHSRELQDRRAATAPGRGGGLPPPRRLVRLRASWEDHREKDPGRRG